MLNIDKQNLKDKSLLFISIKHFFILGKTESNQITKISIYAYIIIYLSVLPEIPAVEITAGTLKNRDIPQPCRERLFLQVIFIFRSYRATGHSLISLYPIKPPKPPFRKRISERRLIIIE